MNGRARMQLGEEQESSGTAAPSRDASGLVPASAPLSEVRRRATRAAAGRALDKRDLAGFGALPSGWLDQFGPAPQPKDPTVDELKEQYNARRAADPGLPELTGIELAQQWARDLDAFRYAERKRFRIDELVESMVEQLPEELWLPSPAAMARSRYSGAETQAIESSNQVDPTPLRSKLFTMLAGLRGEKLDPLAPTGPIWNEQAQDMVAVEISSQPLTDDENLILWFLFPSEMLEWARRELAVQDSVARERDRRGGEVAGGAAGGALQFIAVASIPTLLSAGALALPFAATGYGGLSSGTASVGWGVTSTAMRVAPRVVTWALQNPAYALALGSAGINIAHDIYSGEFSFWNLPFYFGDIMMARGSPSGGGGTPRERPRSSFGWLPQPVKNTIASVQIGLAGEPSFRGTSGSTLGVVDTSSPTITISQSASQSGGVTTRIPNLGEMPDAPMPFAPAVSQRTGGIAPDLVPDAPVIAPSGASQRTPTVTQPDAVPDVAPVVTQTPTPTPAATQAPAVARTPAPASVTTPASQTGTPSAADAVVAPTVASPNIAQTQVRPTQQQQQRDAGLGQQQHDALRQGLGQRFTDPAIRILGDIWDAVANPGERAQLTLTNARRLFNNQRRRFWAAVRRDPAARALLVQMGWDGGGSANSAPAIVLPDGTRLRLTIDHIVERQTDPTQALDAANLRLSSWRENVVVLRLIHLLDPFVNPPPGWTPNTGGVQPDDIDWDLLTD